MGEGSITSYRPTASDDDRAFRDSWVLNDNLVAWGVGKPIEIAVAEARVVELGQSFCLGSVGFDDEAGDPVTADRELVKNSRLLVCEALEARVVVDE